MQDNSFYSYLTERLRYNEKKATYLQNWVAKYHAFKKGRPSGSVADYLSMLSARFEPWQILQAKEAVYLYLRFTGKLPTHDTPYKPTLPYKAKVKNTEDPKPQAQKASSVIRLWDEATRIMRQSLRIQHKSYATEKTYLGWVERFAQWTRLMPDKLTEQHVKKYLSYLAVDRKVAVATQRQAFNALLYFYRYVLAIPIEDLSGTVASKIPQRLPVVLSKKEIDAALLCLPALHKLMCRIISSMRMIGQNIEMGSCCLLP
ncbi:site-specific integrase [Sediminispirochaeta smaragdinae]|uniref:site-specific integrase n=1 Tax=Sediminispirochaeta smaragdinae TaxID=55206 RepID=UPI00030309F1|nr:site-specific integrase [Sediminispirochaeta smaragdinae]